MSLPAAAEVTSLSSSVQECVGGEEEESVHVYVCVCCVCVCVCVCMLCVCVVCVCVCACVCVCVCVHVVCVCMCVCACVYMCVCMHKRGYQSHSQANAHTVSSFRHSKYFHLHNILTPIHAGDWF